MRILKRVRDFLSVIDQASAPEPSVDFQWTSEGEEADDPLLPLPDLSEGEWVEVRLGPSRYWGRLTLWDGTGWDVRLFRERFKRVWYWGTGEIQGAQRHQMRKLSREELIAILDHLAR